MRTRYWAASSRMGYPSSDEIRVYRTGFMNKIARSSSLESDATHQRSLPWRCAHGWTDASQTVVTSCDSILQKELPAIAKIIRDETWLESERRGFSVFSHDSVVVDNVCLVVLRIGAELRQSLSTRRSWISTNGKRRGFSGHTCSVGFPQFGPMAYDEHRHACRHYRTIEYRP